MPHKCDKESPNKQGQNTQKTSQQARRSKGLTALPAPVGDLPVLSSIGKSLI